MWGSECHGEVAHVLSDAALSRVRSMAGDGSAAHAKRSILLLNSPSAAGTADLQNQVLTVPRSGEGERVVAVDLRQHASQHRQCGLST